VYSLTQGGGVSVSRSFSLFCESFERGDLEDEQLVELAEGDPTFGSVGCVVVHDEQL
jgi:hypothetical protein